MAASGVERVSGRDAAEDFLRVGASSPDPAFLTTTPLPTDSLHLDNGQLPRHLWLLLHLLRFLLHPPPAPPLLLLLTPPPL